MSVAAAILPEQEVELSRQLSRHARIARAQRKATARVLTKAFGEVVAVLRPDLIVEIGAHEGRFSLMMRRQMPAARIIAFEAHPEVFETHRLALQSEGVEVVHACVGASDGRQTLHVPIRPEGQQRLTMGSVLLHEASSSFQTFDVPAVKLDSFLGAAAEQPNAMWIDVEGAVEGVIAGAPAALRSCQALLVEVEPTGRWSGQITSEAVKDALSSFGLSAFARDVEKGDRQFNAIFVRTDRLSDEVNALLPGYLERAKQVTAAAGRAFVATKQPP